MTLDVTLHTFCSINRKLRQSSCVKKCLKFVFVPHAPHNKLIIDHFSLWVGLLLGFGGDKFHICVQINIFLSTNVSNLKEERISKQNTTSLIFHAFIIFEIDMKQTLSADILLPANEYILWASYL